MNGPLIQPLRAHASRASTTTLALVAFLALTLVVAPLSVDAKPPSGKGQEGSAESSAQVAKPAQRQSREEPPKILHVHPQRLQLDVGETVSLRAFRCADDGRDRSRTSYRPADDPACELSRNATWRVAKGRLPGAFKAKAAAVSFTASKPAAAVTVIATSPSGLNGTAEMSIEPAAAPAAPPANKPRAAKPRTTESSGSAKPKTNEHKTAEQKATEPGAAEPKPEKPKNTEPKAAEPKAAEPKAAKPKATEPKAAKPKAAKPKAAKPGPARPNTSKRPETAKPKTVPQEATKPKVTRPETAEPKAAKPRTATPRPEDATAVNPRAARPKAAEPERAAPRANPAGPRSGNARRDTTSPPQRASERLATAVKTPDDDKRSAAGTDTRRAKGRGSPSAKATAAITAAIEDAAPVDESLAIESPSLYPSDALGPSSLDTESPSIDARLTDTESLFDPDAVLPACEGLQRDEESPTAPAAGPPLDTDETSLPDPDADLLHCAEPPVDPESPGDPGAERPALPADDPVPGMPAAKPDYDYSRAAAHGRWFLAGADIVQSANGPVDYLSGVRPLPDTFRVSARILLPPGGGGPGAVGAGLVVSMRKPGDLRHGYLVRFARGGRELFWGRYGADGLFYAQDGVSAVAGQGAWRRLELDVSGGSMRIAVDGTTVARGVPVGSGDRYFGLLGFGGSVRFRDVQVVTDGGVQPLSGR